MNEFLARAYDLQEELVQNRRWLHQHPELGHDLDQTVAYVKDRLRELGYTPEDIGDHGVTALAGRPGGRCILLRADMDALPMREDTGEPFRVDGDKMHACGHDIHTAVLLGAARLLKEREGALKGQVKLVFQPAEEVMTGAKSLIEAGVLEDPHVDAALALHVDVASRYRPGTLTMHRPGVASASCDRYIIHIQGKGGHGATPQESVDPINVGAHIYLALQEIVSREVPPSAMVVLTQGIFQAGDAPNVIPGTARLEGTLRCYDNQVRRQVLERMEQMVETTARAFRAEARLEVTGGCAPVYNDPVLFDQVAGWIEELDGKQWMDIDGQVSPASEDFSNFLERVPGVFFFVTAGDSAEGYTYCMHHPKVVFDERALPRGAAGMAWLAWRWLEEHGADS